MQLRPYQENIKEKIQKARRNSNHKQHLVYAPTGSGKTVMFCSFIKDYLKENPNAVIFIVVHLTVLIGQTAKTLDSFGIPYGIVWSEHKEDRSKNVQIISAQTWELRYQKPRWQGVKPDLIILDEAHRTAYRKSIQSKYLKRHFIDFETDERITEDKALTQGLEFFNISREKFDQAKVVKSQWDLVKSAISKWKEDFKEEHKGRVDMHAEVNLITLYFATIDNFFSDYFDYFKNKEALNIALDHENTWEVIGFTATPRRLTGATMKDYFYDLISEVDIKTLMSFGYLVPAIKYRCLDVALETKHLNNNSKTSQQLDIRDLCSDPYQIGKLVEEYREHKGDRALVFGIDKEHCYFLQKNFKKAGYKFEVILAEVSNKERKRLYAALKQGTIDGLISCDVLSEGYDLPEADMALLCRPTDAISVYVQQAGRVLRPAYGKEFSTIIDMAGHNSKWGVVETIDFVKTFKNDSYTMLPELPGALSTFNKPALDFGTENRCPDNIYKFYAPYEQDEDILIDCYQKNLQYCYQMKQKRGAAFYEFQRRFAMRSPKREWSKNAICGTDHTVEVRFAYYRYLHETEQKANLIKWYIELEFGGSLAAKYLKTEYQEFLKIWNQANPG